jgi:CDP-glucose 4,6-dehydratase
MAHYLITGHTGFKGSWLTLLLKSRGHEVSGLALDPLPGSLFERAHISSDLTHDFRVDVRNRDGIVDSFQQAKPDVVIHMAAQALVREGYRDPIGTYETNVNGTLHVLQASDATDSVTSQLIVTTDKVYRDDGLRRPYVESDPLGGKDPYSASKAMADILAQEYFHNERTKPGAIARAGNVIGAGDTSRDRLIPDIVLASRTGKALELRYPKSVRPWQHVLDCLQGYLSLLDSVPDQASAGAWNFGPEPDDRWSVIDVVRRAKGLGLSFDYVVVPAPALEREADLLDLDSKKANEKLLWRPRILAKQAVGEALSESLAQGTIGLREVLEAQIREHD